MQIEAQIMDRLSPDMKDTEWVSLHCIITTKIFPEGIICP